MSLDIGVLDGVFRRGLERALTGRALTRTDRHGKQLFFRIGKGRWLTVHLGMTGGLMFLERWAGSAPIFTRVRFDFEDGASLVFEDMRKFGAIGLTPSKASFLEREETGTGRAGDRKGGFCGPSIATSTPHQDGPAGPVRFGWSGQPLLGRGSVPMRSAPDGPGGRTGRGSVRLHPPELGHRAEIRPSMLGTDFDHLPEGYMLKARHPSSHCPKGHGPWHTMKVNGRTAYFCPQCQRL